MFFRICTLLFFLFLTPVFALENESYYADLTLFLDERGYLSIEGESNFQEFFNINNTDEYTSKSGNLWTLSLKTEEVFDNYSYRLHAPSSLRIEKFKEVGEVSVHAEEDHLVVEAYNRESPFQIEFEYRLDNEKTDPLSSENEENELIFMLGLLGGSFLLFLGGFLLLFWRKNIRRSQEKVSIREKDLPENAEVELRTFSLRQQEIITILKEEGKITQKELQRILDIPKSSISRNIKSLESSGVIVSKRIGLVNYLFLKE